MPAPPCPPPRSSSSACALQDDALFAELSLSAGDTLTLLSRWGLARAALLSRLARSASHGESLWATADGSKNDRAALAQAGPQTLRHRRGRGGQGQGKRHGRGLVLYCLM